MARIGKDSLWNQPGSESYSVVLPQIDGTSLIVIAGGQAYLIDIEKRCWLALFGGAIDAAIAVPEASRFILAGASHGMESGIFALSMKR
jgi:hypothetical protein